MLQGRSAKPTGHKTVMVLEVVKGLGLSDDARLNLGKRFIDATVGEGGHAIEIIKKGGFVLGIDLDSETLRRARRRLAKYKKNLILVHGNFKNIEKIAEGVGMQSVDGVVFDLGVTSTLLTDSKRGFSFQNPEALLDMRIDQKNQKVTASDLLNILREDQLTDLFSKVMTKSESKSLARKIIEKRSARNFQTMSNFLEVANKVRKKKMLHPATLPLLALRIAVNSELENLQEGLTGALSLLKRRGRLLVISFHSLEEGIVKNFFSEKEKLGVGLLLTKEPITASQFELKVNPRARSARLRIFEKL